MAAVFDLDLETEEGSEGEGEPEFSPAVSDARARLDPGPIPSPRRWDTSGSLDPEGALLQQTSVCLRSQALLSSDPTLTPTCLAGLQPCP